MMRDGTNCLRRTDGSINQQRPDAIKSFVHGFLAQFAQATKTARDTLATWAKEGRTLGLDNTEDL